MSKDIVNTIENDFNKVYSNNIFNNKLNALNNFLLANQYIPEMSLETELIIINGKINDKKIKIMIDTGATVSTIFKSAIEKYNIEEDIIDKNNLTDFYDTHGINKTIGTIWFLEIELETNTGHLILPTNVEIINDNQSDEFINYRDFDLILGINFLKYYRANIDFVSKMIILDEDIKIKFN